MSDEQKPESASPTPPTEPTPSPEPPRGPRLSLWTVMLIALGIVLLVLLALRAVETWQGRGSPDAFQIGSFAVRWYGILLMTGAFCGALLGEAEARRRGLNSDHVWNILLLGLVLGVIVSRLWYVLGDWQAFSGDVLKIIGFENGQWVGLRGLTIHGALFGAVIAVAVYVLWKKLDFWTWLDVGAPGFVLGQAIGRWGNFFNQEAYGPPTTLPWGISIGMEHRIPPYNDLAAYPQTTRFHPTFLYESLMNLAICLFLLFLARRYGRYLVRGEIFCFYGILYGLGRFGMEFLRTDSIKLGPFPAAQVVSLGLVLLCGGILAARRWIWKCPRGA